ncbi:hypothetical protein JMJ77_0004829, partial [Colletotrichum scovillei]
MGCSKNGTSVNATAPYTCF